MNSLRNAIKSGVIVSWRPWQMSLALLGVVVYFGATNGDRIGGAVSRETPFAQIAQDDHEAPVWSLAFAGSRRLASSTSSELRVKDLATGEVVRLLDCRESFGLKPAFSPEGRTLAVGVNGPEIRFWDADTCIEQEPLSLGTQTARYVVFSPDGAILAVAISKSRKVTLYDWRRARPLAVLDGLGGEVNILAFSPDGSRLIAADSSSHVCIWDLASRKARARWRAHAAGISAVAHSPNGELIATASYLDNAIRLWDSASGEPRGILQGAGAGVTGIAFSPDGTELAQSRSDGVASLWDLASARQVGAVTASADSLQAIAFAADGRVFATSGFDGAVRYWDVARAIGAERRRP
jgi:WD40 repeat protein